MVERFNKFLVLILVSFFIFLSVYLVFSSMNNVIGFSIHPLKFEMMFVFAFSMLFILLTVVAYMFINQKALTKKQSKIIQAFDILEDEIAIVDSTSLKYIYLNRGFIKNLLYKKEELVDKSIMNLYPTYQIETIQQYLEPLLKKEIDSLTYEITRTKKDGTTYQALIKLKYFSDSNILLAVSRDITNEHESENEKEQCVSSLNHNVRTSLTKISGALKIILSGMVGEIPTTMTEMLNLANENTIKLIDDISEFMNEEHSKL